MREINHLRLTASANPNGIESLSPGLTRLREKLPRVKCPKVSPPLRRLRRRGAGERWRLVANATRHEPVFNCQRTLPRARRGAPEKIIKRRYASLCVVTRRIRPSESPPVEMVGDEVTSLQPFHPHSTFRTQMREIKHLRRITCRWRKTMLDSTRVSRVQVGVSPNHAFTPSAPPRLRGESRYATVHQLHFATLHTSRIVSGPFYLLRPSSLPPPRRNHPPPAALCQIVPDTLGWRGRDVFHNVPDIAFPIRLPRPSATRTPTSPASFSHPAINHRLSAINQSLIAQSAPSVSGSCRAWSGCC
jgi:hypothetical protein